MLTEYNSGKGRADYAYVSKKRPAQPCRRGQAAVYAYSAMPIEQTINYCIQDGIDYFAITNGDNWEVYETHKKVPIAG